MSPLAEEILPMLPGLRRYARALVGDRRTGDWYVRIALETLLEEPFRVRADGDVRLQLYRLLGDVLSIEGVEPTDISDQIRSDEIGSGETLGDDLLRLPLLTRHLFLLVRLEGFSVQRAAKLFAISVDEVETHLVWAREQLQARPSHGPVPRHMPRPYIEAGHGMAACLPRPIEAA